VQFKTVVENVPDSRIVGSAAPDRSEGIHSVYETLRNAHATLERFAWLGDELAVAVWQREGGPEVTSYTRPGHHTLSCYLDGGYGAERHTMPGLYGAPSRLCALPGDHESNWWVRTPMRFMHIYFLPEHFTRRAVVELDREPRELTLADRTYFEDPAMAELCAHLAAHDWDHADGLLQANEVVHDVLNRLLHGQTARAAVAPRGGLSIATRRATISTHASTRRSRWVNWRWLRIFRNSISRACSPCHSACRRMHGSPSVASTGHDISCAPPTSRSTTSQQPAVTPTRAI
jgi:hypothetical protein